MDKSKCVACGSCIKVCPRGAISVKGIYAEVDLQKCGCGLCAKICPASVITIMQHNTSQEDWIMKNKNKTGMIICGLYLQYI